MRNGRRPAGAAQPGRCAWAFPAISFFASRYVTLPVVGKNPILRSGRVRCNALKTEREHLVPNVLCKRGGETVNAIRNILIVDDDLGFLFWLGSILTAAHYRPWPACSISDALDLVGREPVVRLDLLIVNPTLPGISQLIALFRRTQPHLKVMGLGRRNKAALPDVDAWHLKPGPIDRAAGRKWVRAIKGLSVSGRSAQPSPFERLSVTDDRPLASKRAQPRKQLQRDPGYLGSALAVQ